MPARNRTRWKLADCPGLDRLPPTQFDLPDDDEEKMPSKLHVLQMFLLMETLRRWLAGRRECFIGGDMFVYFSPDQRVRHRFCGPDFFVVLDVPDYPRRNWVVWEEGGRAPDVVIELLSDSTAREDRRTKKDVYQDILRVPEYYWYDPEKGEFTGFRLVEGVYEELPPDDAGRLPCTKLGLMLVVWEGACYGYRNRWLRWATPDRALLPTEEEATAAALAQTAEAEQRATTAEQRAAEAEAQIEEYRRRFGDLPR